MSTTIAVEYIQRSGRGISLRIEPASSHKTSHSNEIPSNSRAGLLKCLTWIRGCSTLWTVLFNTCINHCTRKLSIVCSNSWCPIVNSMSKRACDIAVVALDLLVTSLVSRWNCLWSSGFMTRVGLGCGVVVSGWTCLCSPASLARLWSRLSRVVRLASRASFARSLVESFVSG